MRLGCPLAFAALCCVNRQHQLCRPCQLCTVKSVLKEGVKEGVLPLSTLGGHDKRNTSNQSARWLCMSVILTNSLPHTADTQHRDAIPKSCFAQKQLPMQGSALAASISADMSSDREPRSSSHTPAALYLLYFAWLGSFGDAHRS